jgi:hypothetical protein
VRAKAAPSWPRVTRQLRGTAGDRALPGKPAVGVVSNAVGGFAGCALITAD